MFFDDGEYLAVVRGEAFATLPHREEIENSGGAMDTSPLPENLEKYPAQPEFLRCRGTIGYALEKLPVRED